MQLHKLEGGWVSYWLSPGNKLRLSHTVFSLLSRFKLKDFLQKIVTGGKKWVFSDHSKRRKLWVNSAEPSVQIAKSNIHEKKLVLRIW